MQYMRGWRALFADPEWGKKLLRGSVLVLSTMCIPMLGQIVLAGYCALVMRRAVQGQDSPLPRLDLDFDYLGKLLGIGFKPFLAQMLWSLALVPVVVVFACVFALLPPLFVQAGDAAPVLVITLVVVGSVLYCAMIAAAQVLTTVASIRASLMEDLGAAIKPRDTLAMARLVLGELVVGNLVLMLIAIPLAFVGMLFLYVGLFPVAIVILHLQTFLHAEIYRRYLEKGGEPLQVGPLDVQPSAAVAPL